jgi:PAS domain S-box-containing protein
METQHSTQLEYILNSISVGTAIIDPIALRILYVNSYLQTLLNETWRKQNIVERHIEDILPKEIYAAALPLLHQVSTTGQSLHLAEVPYEGFLETRGRTYWSIRIECSSATTTYIQQPKTSTASPSLLIIVEDVTEAVRSRLYSKAIHQISSTIADTSALPLVFDGILQALQDMVGSRRCAVFLINRPATGIESHISDYVEAPETTADETLTASIAAQKNVHPSSQNWHPYIDEQLLLGRVIKGRHTLIITDTSTDPELRLPSLDYDGEPVRPGSVLCVPIFDPYPTGTQGKPTRQADADNILGTIEVYHMRARGFPSEEVKLLERFAQQAGLAIQNARLFRSTEHLARIANRNARQRENIMQAIPDGVVLYDPRWRVADVNNAAYKLFGWTHEVIGMTITQAMAHSKAQLHRLDFLSLPDPIEELEYRALNSQIDVFKLVGTDGQAYTVRCSYTPIRDEQGDIFAFVAIYQDLTREAAARERIEAEVVARTAELAQRNAALQLANETQEILRARMELLLERLPSGVIQLDKQDISITLINSRAVQHLQKLGIPLEPHEDPDRAALQAIGLPCEQLFRNLQLFDRAGNPVPYEEQPLYRAISLGEASEAELHTAEVDGQALYFLVNAAPLRVHDDTVTSIILVLHEITTTKTLERTREDFFTTMAHELKTPLANIRAHVSALLASDMHWSQEKQMDFLRTADEQVDRLVGMINHFLDASRVEARALRLEIEPIILAEMIEDLQERLEALITSSGRHLEIILPPDTPAVMGDYEHIISVLTNLLSNAFRYAPEGDTVTLKAEPVFATKQKQLTGITLSVIDRGPGMSAERQRMLFTRFSTFAARHRPTADRPGQPPIERRRGSGRWSPATGLGLYISRGIIEAHGSTLVVKSKPGKGTTFSFTLPVSTGKQDIEPMNSDIIN